MPKQQPVAEVTDKSASPSLAPGGGENSTCLLSNSISSDSQIINEAIESRNERLRNDVFSNYSNAQVWPGATVGAADTPSDVILVENQRRDQKGANSGLKVQQKTREDFEHALIAHLHTVFTGDSSSQSLKVQPSSQNGFQSREELAAIQASPVEEARAPELTNNELDHNGSSAPFLSQGIENTLSEFSKKELSFEPENLEAKLLELVNALEKEGATDPFEMAWAAVQQNLIRTILLATNQTEGSDPITKTKRFEEAISLLPKETLVMYPQLQEELKSQILGSEQQVKQDLLFQLTNLSKERGQLLGLEHRGSQEEQRLNEIAQSIETLSGAYLGLNPSLEGASELQSELKRHQVAAQAETFSQNVYLLAREVALFEAEKLKEASERETDSNRGALSAKVLAESSRNKRLNAYLESQREFLSDTPLMAELTQRAYNAGLSAGFARREELSQSIDTLCKELDRRAWRADTKAIEQILGASDAETLRIYSETFEARTGKHFAQTINDRYGKNRPIIEAYRLAGSKAAAHDLPSELKAGQSGSVLSNQFETLLYELHSTTTRNQAHQKIADILSDLKPDERAQFFQVYARSYGSPFQFIAGVPNDEVAYSLAALMTDKKEELEAFQLTRKLDVQGANPIETVLEATRFLSQEELSALLQGYRAINDQRSLVQDLSELASTRNGAGDITLSEELQQTLGGIKAATLEPQSELAALAQIQLAAMDQREREAFLNGDTLTTTAFLLDHALRSSNPILNVHRVTGGVDPRANQALIEHYQEIFEKAYVDPRTVEYQRSRENLTDRIRRQMDSMLSSSNQAQNYRLDLAESRTGISGQLFTRWNSAHAEYYKVGIEQAESDRKLKFEKFQQMRNDLEVSEELFRQSAELEERARELQLEGKAKEAGELYQESQRAFIESLRIMQQTQLVTLTEGAQETLRQQGQALDNALVWYDRTHAVLKTTQTLCYVAVTIGSGGTAGALLVTGANVVEAGGHVAMGNKTVSQAAKDGTKQAGYELLTSVGITKAGMFVAGRGSSLVFRGAPQGVTAGVIRTSVGGGVGSAGFGATVESANQLESAYHSLTGAQGYENFSVLDAGTSILGAGASGFGYGLLGAGMSHVALNAKSGVTAAFARHGDIGTSAGAGLLFDGPEGALSGALFARIGHLQARNHQMSQLKAGGYLPQSGPREGSFKMDGIVRSRAEVEVREASVRMRDDTKLAQRAQNEPGPRSEPEKPRSSESGAKGEDARVQESAAEVRTRLVEQIKFNERLIENGGLLSSGQKVDVEVVRADNIKLQNDLTKLNSNETAVKTLLKNSPEVKPPKDDGPGQSDQLKDVTRRASAEEPAAIERVRLEQELAFNKRLIERGGTLQGGARADLNLVRAEVLRLETRISEMERASTPMTEFSKSQTSLDSKAEAKRPVEPTASETRSVAEVRRELVEQVKFNEQLIANGGRLKDGFKVNLSDLRLENTRLQNQISSIDARSASLEALSSNVVESRPTEVAAKEPAQARVAQKPLTPQAERAQLQKEFIFNQDLIRRGGTLQDGYVADLKLVQARNEEIEARLLELSGGTSPVSNRPGATKLAAQAAARPSNERGPVLPSQNAQRDFSASSPRGRGNTTDVANREGPAIVKDARAQETTTEVKRLEEWIAFNEGLIKNGGVLSSGQKVNLDSVRAELEKARTDLAVEKVSNDWSPSDLGNRPAARPASGSKPESPAQAAKRLSDDWRPDDLYRPVSPRPNSGGDTISPYGSRGGNTPGVATLERPATSLRTVTQPTEQRVSPSETSRLKTPPRPELQRQTRPQSDLRQVALAERSPDPLMQARLEYLFRGVTTVKPTTARVEVKPELRAKAEPVQRPEVRTRLEPETQPRLQVETRPETEVKPHIRLDPLRSRPDLGTPRPEKRVARRIQPGDGAPGDFSIRASEDKKNPGWDSSIERAAIEAEMAERNRRARFQTRIERDEDGNILGVRGGYIGEG
jgi:hypothetical protein